ncbi:MULTISPECIES: PspC domain-containing protein [Dietzia]|uniref:PspC domain-containing protein n=1 Tax=Dietzia TaxID=37914 RepID=UPI0019D037AC|nr:MULTISPECIES: PspC domain-containing protein [Dietzia]MCT1433445.1 PspC domain-containing protein [Dietzia maris]MCT1521909.1 PspC domain-containing protein [Dietzia maris]
MTYSPDSGPKRLMRSEDRWIGGVCGGLADYFGLDPALVRLLFVASILLPGPQLLIYVILWFVMPDSRASRARD